MARLGSRQETILDLGRLGLSHGEGRRLDVPLDEDTLTLGGQEYSGAVAAGVRLEISRTAHGWALHLLFRSHLEGPCTRCLEPASLDVDVEAREVEEPTATDEELRSPYVEGEELELSRWAHDALALALPLKLLCRPDCAGLCPVCGVSLNDADPAEHEHEPIRDPRWSALDELR